MPSQFLLKAFLVLSMIQAKVLFFLLMIFSSTMTHDIFLKAPFPGIRQSHENINSACGSGLHTVSLRQFLAPAFSNKTSKFELSVLKNQKLKRRKSVFIKLKNPKSIFFKKSYAIRALTHYLGWAILQCLVLWCLLSKGLFSRPKQFLILYSLLYFEL